MKIISIFFLTSLSVFFSLLTHAQNQISPSRASLIDTGYDACVITGGSSCENNRNLLFKGNQPLDEDNHFQYNADVFRAKIFSYLQAFKQHADTKASFPQSLAELKNYRIVIINLLYDWYNQGSDSEYGELTNEFKYSGSSTTLQIPEQHKMYGLTNPFNADQFAFEWWPITLPGEKNPEGIATNLNWPNHNIVPVPRSDQFFKAMDFPYLLTGISYADDTEEGALDLKTLLTMQPTDNHPLLIFYHCVAGVDRTGAVTLGYFMKHGGYANVVKPDNKKISRSGPLSFTDALRATTAEDYPAPKKESLIAGQSYCLALGKPAGEC